MGLLDELLGGVLSGVAGQQRGRPTRSPAATGAGAAQIMTALLPVVLSMLANRGGGPRPGGGGPGDILGQVLGGGTAPRAGGGLGGLLEQMQKAGFADQAKSWVGTGQNMPISADAMREIFGKDGLEEIARRTELTPQEASEGLSQLLPEVVDRVTPGGHEPDFDELVRSVDELRKRMGA
jgi:uncharacterized protein YidB (DUF937 family)